MKYTAILLILHTCLVSTAYAQEHRGGDRREPPVISNPKAANNDTYTPPNRGMPDTSSGSGTRFKQRGRVITSQISKVLSSL
ncbi:hypothetical protein LC593_10880 [Nostoc sp. CHAB 5844]|nr:hypothetical protein [Nostoc sp. CHAB 5844]